MVAVCLLLVCTNLATAQTGALCLFSDPDGTNCAISDMSPGLLTIHVVHTNAADVKGAWFSAPLPSCMNGAIYLSDAPNWPVTIGDTQNGVWVQYGSCLSSPIHVSTINIFAQGLTTVDCPYAVLPHPAVGMVQVSDCDDYELAAAGGVTFVNSDLSCVCDASLPDPVLYVSPLAIDFGPTVTNRQFFIGNTGGGTVIWDISESVSWLEVAPTNGAGNATIDVAVDRSGLTPRSYSGQIDVTSNGGNETVMITMGVATPIPVLLVAPAALEFGVGDDREYLAIRNDGTGELTWGVSSDQPWMTVGPATGSGDYNVVVSVDRTGFSDGNYFGNLQVTSNGGDVTVPVEMIVAMQPALSVAPTLLTFSENVTLREFSIANSGFGALSWSLSADETWIDIATPLSGTGDALITVTVDPANVPAGGAQFGHITVSSNGGNQVVDVWFSPPGPAQGGDIGVFADAGGIGCNIVDTAPGVLEVHVVHVYTDGATASLFAAPAPSCMTGVSWLSDEKVFPVTVGDSQTGVAVGYGACHDWPIHVLSIRYVTSGLSETCCMYPVIPAANASSGRIEVVDCANELMFGHGLVSSVNAVGGCICGSVKVEESTWGRVKALYAPEHLKAIRE